MYEHDDETAKAIVKIRKSEPFFGWIAGLGAREDTRTKEFER